MRYLITGLVTHHMQIADNLGWFSSKGIILGQFRQGCKLEDKYLVVRHVNLKHSYQIMWTVKSIKLGIKRSSPEKTYETCYPSVLYNCTTWPHTQWPSKLKIFSIEQTRKKKNLLPMLHRRPKATRPGISETAFSWPCHQTP